MFTPQRGCGCIDIYGCMKVDGDRAEFYCRDSKGEMHTERVCAPSIASDLQRLRTFEVDLMLPLHDQ